MVLSLLLVLALPDQKPTDPITWSFAYFGCNRLDAKDWEPIAAENPSSANIPQLDQNLSDIAALKPLPALTFVVGDLVNNYVPDQGQALRAQLEAWADHVGRSPATKRLRLIAIPGNHELNRKQDGQKLPNLATAKVWADWIRRTGYSYPSSNSPTASGQNLDGLIDNQRAMNYSFNVKGVHFVVLNSDTRTSIVDSKSHEGKISWIPSHWAASDIDRAQRNPRVRSIFILAHRNLVDTDSAKADSPIDSECGSVLLEAIRRNDKVRGFLCAHVHAYDAHPISGSAAWQIVAGNGGSPLEKDWNPPGGRTFGFVVINVHRSGAVGFRHFDRPIPPGEQKYFESIPVTPPRASGSPETKLSR